MALKWSDPEVFVKYIDSTDPAKPTDDYVLNALRAAEDFACNYCRQQFWPEPALVAGADTALPVARTIPARGRTYVRFRSLRAAESVVLDGLALEPYLGYALDYAGPDWPASGLWLAYPPQLWYQGLLVITGRWGWLEPPDSIVDGVYRLAARLYSERDARWSDSRVSPDLGIQSYYKALPSSVQMSIDQYRVPLTQVVHV